MGTANTILRTGRSLGVVIGTFLVFGTLIAHGANVDFSAEVDRPRISLDESVSLKLSVRTEGSGSVGNPRFDAPDFEVLNQFNTTYVESYYENGKFGMRNTQQVTKILRPVKQGSLKISGIQIQVGNQTFTAPDIQVQVVGAGAGTPAPRGYGGAGNGLRGSAKRAGGPNVFVRAEVDKSSVYKGEQIVVSYYLYQRVRTYNIQVEKFPMLPSFLREDLEIPVVGQRLSRENVNLDGVGYERYLLARYAAYPLEVGKLKIDNMALKFNYLSGGANLDDEDDPFLNFFRSAVNVPRIGNAQSESLTIQVAPIPEEGRPPTFTGGVGDFNVSAAIDKYDVKANEAVTLTVKVEGKGNLAAIGEPKAQWPDSVEMYDSKGKAKTSKSGVGEKIFEFLLIPRSSGQVTLPPLEFSFFDPSKKEFVTRKTEAITLRVGEAAPGSQNVQKPKTTRTASSGDLNPESTAQDSGKSTLRYLKPPLTAADENGWVYLMPAWRWVYWASLVALAFFIGMVGWDRIRGWKSQAAVRGEKKAKSYSKSWAHLHECAASAKQGAAWQIVSQAYEQLMSAIFDAIDGVYKIGARSLPRSELETILVGEQGLSQEIWSKVAQLLEYAESVRFSSSAGGISEQRAREDLLRWVTLGESLAQSIERQKTR